MVGRACPSRAAWPRRRGRTTPRLRAGPVARGRSSSRLRASYSQRRVGRSRASSASQSSSPSTSPLITTTTSGSWVATASSGRPGQLVAHGVLDVAPEPLRQLVAQLVADLGAERGVVVVEVAAARRSRSRGKPSSNAPCQRPSESGPDQQQSRVSRAHRRARPSRAGWSATASAVLHEGAGAPSACSRVRSAQAWSTSPSRRTSTWETSTGTRRVRRGPGRDREPRQLEQRRPDAGAGVDDARLTDRRGVPDRQATSRATSSTCTRSRVWLPSPCTRSGSPAPQRRQPGREHAGRHGLTGPITFCGRTTVTGTARAGCASARSPSDRVSPSTETGRCGSSSWAASGTARGQQASPAPAPCSSHRCRPRP